MAEVRLDAAAVRTLVRRVLDGADRIDEIELATMSSDAMVGSSVAQADPSASMDRRLADLVAHMRTWAAAATAAVEVIESADAHHVRRLDGIR